MESQEEPDYDALWQQIVADAEAYIAEQQWQARWFEESARSLDPVEWEVAERLAGKAFIRHQIQRFDLAGAITQGDISSYIQRWYPEATARHGYSISFVHYDECELVAAAVYGTPNPGNPAAIWRKYAARRRTQRQLQACQAAGYQLSTWSVSENRVGPRSRLRQWVRRVLRRR